MEFFSELKPAVIPGIPNQLWNLSRIVGSSAILRLLTLKQFEEKNLNMIISGAEYSWTETYHSDGYEVEHHDTHESNGSFIDGLCNWDEDEFIWGVSDCFDTRAYLKGSFFTIYAAIICQN